MGNFVNNGYDDLRVACAMLTEDLEEIGIPQQNRFVLGTPIKFCAMS